jgi:hypothetical protein
MNAIFGGLPFPSEGFLGAEVPEQITDLDKKLGWKAIELIHKDPAN